MNTKGAKRNLIIEAGAGTGNFSKLLRARHPKMEVLASDINATTRGIIRKSLGELFFEMEQDQARRIHSVWINHVNLRTTQGNKELKELAKKVPPRVPIIFTIKRENLEATKFSIEAAGLVIKTEQVYRPQMLGSETTKKYYESASADFQLMPIRIVAVKPDLK